MPSPAGTGGVGGGASGLAAGAQPSLILRRMAEGETLWDIAKQYRTDQDAIRSANELTEEARPEGMLLIPRVR